MIPIPSEIHESVVEILDFARRSSGAPVNLYLAAHTVQSKHKAANVAVEDIVELLVAHGPDCCFEINSKSMRSVLYG
jgi:hypothetical protein